MMLLTIVPFWGDMRFNLYVLIINILLLWVFYFSLHTVNKINNINFFSETNLGLIVFIISLFFLCLFKGLYYCYSDSFFEFSAIDSLQYDREAKLISDGDFWTELNTYIQNSKNLEDLGAVFFTSLVYLAFPSTVAFNLSNVLIGTITVIYLFKIAKSIIDVRYAFLGALTYALSTFVIYLYSTGMKETYFVFVIVMGFYNLVNYLKTKNTRYILFSVIWFSLVLFFRPALVVFIFAAIVSANLIIRKRDGWFYFFVSVVVILIILFFETFIRYYEIYTALTSDDVIEQTNVLAPTKFNYAVSYLTGFFGPFPSYPALDGKEQQSFYSIGLCIRVILSMFFFHGIFVGLKKKNIIVLSMAFFVLIEGFILSAILESFELRLNSPHLAFVYIVAFYSIYTISEDDLLKVRFTRYLKLAIPAIFIFILFWNIRLFNK